MLLNHLKIVIDSINDGIYMTDAQGYCIAYNKDFRRITGLDEDVIGKHVSYLKEKGLISETVTEETIRTGRHVSKVINYPSGCEALVTGNPVFDEDGQLIAVICNVKDLTELNALKNKLNKSKQLAKEYIETLKNLQIPINISVENFIVRDSQMQRTLNLIQKVADSDVSIMLLGESGVGKGMMAELIHSQSQRSQKGKLIKVDCGAIPATLLESELFGYESGAFTGARKEGKKGLFELADKGTLFLDEIGELPLDLQVKLLNVLQDKRIKRVGGTQDIPVDLRILCATNRDLEKMIEEGKFRKDLYYRLNVVPVVIPPLRERKEDILVLTASFLKRFSDKYNMPTTILPEVIECFMAYCWPGNVRELENTIERLVVLNPEGVITLGDIPENIRSNYPPFKNEYCYEKQEIRGDILPLKKAIAETECKIIEQAFKKYKKLGPVAEALDIDISTLLRKCRKYGIKRNFNVSKNAI